ncbi:unnamed protein product [Prorocentrum cordatum]|uniref:Clathrin light chain n=1 Tax=Prorocentrum cordatum TaxID=2364126 RepID=A0ABN9VSK5_9DINO|nr:unnamed protein product [Polarella glacialis]
MAVHPPAMGGKTAWGVGEVTSRPTDDPTEILRAKQAQADFEAREEARLQRLKAMEREASNIAETRAARRQAFQPEMTKGVDEFKKRQDEILKRMEEAQCALPGWRCLGRLGVPPPRWRAGGAAQHAQHSAPAGCGRDGGVRGSPSCAGAAPPCGRSRGAGAREGPRKPRLLAGGAMASGARPFTVSFKDHVGAIAEDGGEQLEPLDSRPRAWLPRELRHMRTSGPAAGLGEPRQGQTPKEGN